MELSMRKFVMDADEVLLDNLNVGTGVVFWDVSPYNNSAVYMHTSDLFTDAYVCMYQDKFSLVGIVSTQKWAR